MADFGSATRSSSATSTSRATRWWRATACGRRSPTAASRSSRKLIAATGSDRAAILLFDNAGVMRFKASHSLSEGYRKAVEGHSPWTADSKDPAPILVADVAADTSLGALQDTILAEGIRSLGFIPLGRPGRLLGKFMVYYDQPHDFTETELKVAAMVCHYVAFGLDRAQDETDIQDLFDRERVARHQAEALNRAKDDFLAENPFDE